MKAARLCLTACLVAGLQVAVISCASKAPPPQPPLHPSEVAVVQPETKVEPLGKPEPVQTPPPAQERQEEPVAEQPAEASQTTPPAEQPSSPETAEKPQEYTVTEEVYSKTFDELEALIREWSATIARKDYEGWHSSLSQAYIAERGSPQYLAELSRLQKLKDANIVLRNLKDYFLSVVVPARLEAALDRIAFVSENKVKAYANIGGDPAILYYVVREDNEWKIGTANE